MTTINLSNHLVISSICIRYKDLLAAGEEDDLDLVDEVRDIERFCLFQFLICLKNRRQWRIENGMIGKTTTLVGGEIRWENGFNI